MNKLTALEIAIRHYGTNAAVSRVIGITPQGVGKRLREGRDMTVEECFLVHNDSGIPLSVLRPDWWGAEVLKG